MMLHHPSPEILADWSRGALHESAMLAVGCHVWGCSICRAEAAIWESVGGALLEAAAPQPLSAGALAQALARLDLEDIARTSVRERRLPAYLSRFQIPSPLAQHRIGMRRWVTPKIWFAPVIVAPRSSVRTYLVYADRNTTLPTHTHVGREFTTVLHGSFSDDSGTYSAGDFAETDDTVTHAPAVTADSACLCLISADAPMRLHGAAARAIQTLAGNLY
jgi:putative transcriptional regulator